MAFLQAQGNIEPGEFARTFNCGIGMVLIVDPRRREACRARSEQAGETRLRDRRVVEPASAAAPSPARPRPGSAARRWSAAIMADTVRVAVLISGRGSNMLALSEHKRRDPDRAYEIVLVASNVPDARGLVLAKRLGIKTWAKSHEGMDRAEFDAAARRGAARARRRADRARRLYAAALARIRRANGRAGSSTSTRACCRCTRASTPTGAP